MTHTHVLHVFLNYAKRRGRLRPLNPNVLSIAAGNGWAMNQMFVLVRQPFKLSVLEDSCPEYTSLSKHGYAGKDLRCALLHRQLSGQWFSSIWGSFWPVDRRDLRPVSDVRHSRRVNFRSFSTLVGQTLQVRNSVAKPS